MVALPGGKLRKFLLDGFTDAVDAGLLGILNQVLYQPTQRRP
jgi:hypothetical protein